MLEIIYIGTSSEAIKFINKQREVNLTTVICESKRITLDYEKVVKENKLILISFETLMEFTNIIKKIDPNSCYFLIYQFDFIVPGNIANSYSMFNLHAGNISTNRGRHPIIWSILNGDCETELVIHKIDDKIDKGLIIGAFKIKIDQEDGFIEIKGKLENGIPYLINCMVDYSKGKIKGTPAPGGIYKSPINEKDYTINILTDSAQKIKNKIRSQKQYKGAILELENKRYYIKNIELNEEIQNKNSSVITENHLNIIIGGKAYKLHFE